MVLTVEISCDDPEMLRKQAVVAQVLSFAAGHIGLLPSGDVTLSLRLADKQETARLHEVFFSDPSDTDVMSFPAEEASIDTSRYLGDIAISLDVAAAQALDQGHSLTREIAYLSLHGLLHLLGHDDDDEGQRREMHHIQSDLLERYESLHGTL